MYVMPLFLSHLAKERNDGIVGNVVEFGSCDGTSHISRESLQIKRV